MSITGLYNYFCALLDECDFKISQNLKNARIMPDLKIMPNSIFQYQTHLKNAKFVKSGIEKCQLAALAEVESGVHCCSEPGYRAAASL